MRTATFLPGFFRQSYFSGPIARSAYTTITLRIASIGIGFVTTLFLARVLGAQGVGVYAFGAGIAIMAAMFSRLGIQTQMSRDTAVYLNSGDWPRLKGALWFGIIASIVSAIAFGFLAILYFLLAGNSSQLVAAGLLSVCLAPFLAIAAAFQGRLRGGMKNFYAYVPELAVAPVATLMLIAVLYSLNILTAMTALMAFAAGWVMATLLSVFFVLQSESAQIKSASVLIEWKQWIKGSATLAAASIITIAAGRIELVALSVNFGAAELGLYAVAFRFAQFTTFPGFALSSGFGPVIAALHAQGDHHGVRRRIWLGAWMNFIGSLIAGAAITGASWIVLPLLGPEFIAGRPLVAIMCAGFVLQSLAGRPADILTMLNFADAAAKAGCAVFAVYMIAIAALVPALGVVAAAIITASAYVAHNTILAIIVSYKTGRRCDVFAKTG